MDANKRAKTALILEHILDLAREGFHRQLLDLYANHTSRGCLQSGGTIKAAIRIMEEHGERTIAECSKQVAAVSQATEAFSMLKEAMQAYISFLETRLDDVIRKATGNSPADSIADAARNMFNETKTRLERQLEILSFDFAAPDTEMPSASPSIAVESSESKMRGGRALAKHWDQMWSALAVALYNGDLQPEKQADIECAMKDFLERKNLDVSDSAIRERARILWQDYQKASAEN